MATLRMDITSFVGKLLDQDDVDALREGKRVLAHAVMETEVSTQIGAGPTSGAPNGLPTQRVPHPSVGHRRRHDRAQDPQGHRRRLLPLAAGAPPASRESTMRSWSWPT